MSHEEQQSSYLRIFAATVFVRDHERALRFYVDQLGFKVVADERLELGRWIAIAPPDGSTILALINAKRGSPHYKLIGRETHITLMSEDIHATYDLWRARGVEFRHPPQRQIWGGTFATFCDADDNAFSLVSSDEITREIEEQRRADAARLEAERRAAQEMEIAKQVQARLFPQTLPPLRTLDYAGACMQARHVGGDYYDFFALDEARVGLFIGDISGKGIAAALLMANLQANLRSQFALARDEPQRFLQSVNQLFYENSVDSAYATVFFAAYDDTTQRLHYANCGHLSALLLRARGGGDQVERLHSTATVLGLFRDWESPIVTCQLAPGDLLAIYTDGVTEACSANGEEFGEDRLIAALQQQRNSSAQQTINSVIAQLREFSAEDQHDDITLIVAQCREGSVKADSP